MSRLNNINLNVVNMFVLDLPANDVGTTFNRYSTEFYLSNPVTTTLFQEESLVKLFEGKYKRADIPVYTNLETRSRFKPSFAQLTINDSVLGDDIDFYIPLKPRKSFTVRAKVKTVAKFRPKAVFE